MTPHRGRVAIFALVAIPLIVLFWAFLAPTKLGGSTTYSVTAGISMQPLLYKNDLALVRAEPSYHLGDVVLYNSPVLHRQVLHRIILIQNGNYFFRGDNNGFVDPGYATRAELVGKLWVHLATAGKVLSWFGVPMHAALLAGPTAMAVVLAGTSAPRRRGRRHHGSRSHRRRLPVPRI